MLGKILSSRYEIISSIGQGGFGKTYLAKDIQLPGNPQCVVKQFHPTVSTPDFLDVARRLFNTEAQTLQKLGNHNQIPLLLAHFEEEKEFYLVQQYVEGDTLSKELIIGQCWSEQNIIEFMQDCLQILDFVHSQGVIHRDVKPDNLIRRQQDRKLVLVDFGTVKEIINSNSNSQIVNSTVAVGTRGYMPTEQARGRPRITSDIYALGIIGIQAATGIHPMEFKEDENGELVWQSQAQVSSELIDILSKMVRYHFKDRYKSAQEVSQVLESLSGKDKAPSASAVPGYVPTEVVDLSEIDNFSNTQNTVAPKSQTEIAPPSESDIKDLNSSIPASGQSISAATPSISIPSSSQPVSTSTPEKNTSNQSENPKGNLLETFSNFIKSQTGKTMSFALLFGVVGTGGVYFTNHKTAIAEQEQVKTVISGIEEKHQKQEYQSCYEEAETALTIETTTKAEELDNKRIELAVKCRLKAAEKKANLVDYEGAIAIARVIPENSPNSKEVQEKLAQWSGEILKDATKLYSDKGNLKSALEKLDLIPDNSGEVKKLALSKSSEWRANNDKNDNLISTAKASLDSKNWTKALEEAKKVQGSSYWIGEAQNIIKEAEKSIAVKSTPAPAPAITSPPVRYTNSTPKKSVRKTTVPPKRKTTYTPPPKRKVIPPKPIIRKPTVVNLCPGPLCHE